MSKNPTGAVNHSGTPFQLQEAIGIPLVLQFHPNNTDAASYRKRTNAIARLSLAECIFGTLPCH